MPTQPLFTDTGRLVVAAALLAEIEATGKTKPKAQQMAIAHGLAVDRHVDGRLRLTPAGAEKLAHSRR